MLRDLLPITLDFSKFPVIPLGQKLPTAIKGERMPGWQSTIQMESKFGLNKLERKGMMAGHGIAVTSKGDIFVAGYSHGDMEESGSTSNDADAWVAKFTNDGKKLWLKHIGSRADDVAYDIAVDSFGHAYVGGYTRGRIAANSEDQGNKQIWVMKLDDNGGSALAERVWPFSN